VTDPRVTLPPAFVDSRGSIQNLFEAGDGEEHAGGVAVIRSREGAVRSEHWHRTDHHWLHVLSGHIIYEWRPAMSNEEPRRIEIAPGETFFTPSHVWHRVTSVTPSIMISVSRLSRKHDVHEADLVRDP